MSIFTGLTKEFKVGMLTAVSLTILIMGYNFMLGKDNPLQRGREFVVYYDSSRGLSVGTSVIYNGFRIGQLTSLQLVNDGQAIEAKIEISSDLKIPKDSKLKVESELLGGQKMKLVRGVSNVYAEDGDTLKAMYSKDQFSAMNDRILPLVSKADSLLSSMNAFFKSAAVDKAMQELPLAVISLKSTLDRIDLLVSSSTPGITSTLNNAALFSTKLQSYSAKIDGVLKSFDRVGKQLDTVDIGLAVSSLTTSSQELADLLGSISKGEGSLGKLAKDPQLYYEIQKGTIELNRVLLDLKKYPEKYIPVPFTSSQRKKAKEASKKDKQVWGDSATSK
jgi:phospholipid/cholesterol/gamma-HCH transport system substrate-binding protein